MIAYLDESGAAICVARNRHEQCIISQQTRPLSQEEIVQRQKLADSSMGQRERIY